MKLETGPNNWCNYLHTSAPNLVLLIHKRCCLKCLKISSSTHSISTHPLKRWSSKVYKGVTAKVLQRRGSFFVRKKRRVASDPPKGALTTPSSDSTHSRARSSVVARKRTTWRLLRTRERENQRERTFVIVRARAPDTFLRWHSLALDRIVTLKVFVCEGWATRKGKSWPRATPRGNSQPRWFGTISSN